MIQGSKTEMLLRQPCSEVINENTIDKTMYYDKHKCKVKAVFNITCVVMFSLGVAGMLHEFDFFGEGDPNIDGIDKVDIGIYGGISAIWLGICAIGNVAFCQRDKINEYWKEKRSVWNWFCPSAFDLSTEAKYRKTPGHGSDAPLEPKGCCNLF